MWGSTVFLVSALALHSSFALKNFEEPRRKSFLDAEKECAEYLFITSETLERYRSQGYPDEPSVRKLLNCIEINLNAWDEDLNRIKDYVFKQFFVPNTVECRYVQLTQECLALNVDTLDASDRLGRAYQTFQCYYRHYAGISEEVKWVPFHFSGIVLMVEDCLRIVPQSNESLVQYCQGNFSTNPDYPPAAFCFTERAEFYNRTTGFDLERLYVQYGNEDLLDDDTAECLAVVKRQYCQEPDRLVHSVLDCLINLVPVVRDITAGASSVLGYPPECGVPPSPPPETQPCYNAACQSEV